MYCPYCGKQISDGAKFCGFCGRQITARPAADGNVRHGGESGRESHGESDVQSGGETGAESGVKSGGETSKKSGVERKAGKQDSGRQGNRKQNRRHRGVLIAAASVLIVLLCAFFFGRSVLVNSGGDSVYVPADEDLAYDEDEAVFYYDNVIMVYLYEEPTSEVSEALAKSVNGTVAGQITGSVNMLQITVESTDLEGINACAATLMESEEVIYAGYDYPVFIETDDSNPWSDAGTISDKGDEDSPGGNDWWAEAVGAYTAWAIADVLELDSVKAGVLDAGFDLDHEDLKSDISKLSGYGINSEENHGTHVAGIIAADDNSTGIRGIADSAQLICGDLTPDSRTSYMSSGEYAEMIKVMAESGVKVINNSWGAGVVSAAGYAQSLSDNEDTESVNALQLIEVYATGAYESYINYMQTYCKRTAMDCLLLIFQLDCAGYEDLLLVKSAGNGYTDVTEGLETAVYSGFFGSITEDLFNSLTLSSHGYTYSDIRDHILVVGAVKNETDSDGNYLMTDFSNWGDMVDICAPGYEIYSTLTNNDYGTMSGTSMAAPMVTGAAALLWQINEDFTLSEIRALLLDSTQTAVGVGDDSGAIYPMLNIGDSVTKTLCAWYGGSVTDTDGNALEGLTVTALDENENTLYSDVTGEDGTYAVYCSMLEIKYVIVTINDEEAGRIEVPDEYQHYNAAAAKDPSDADFEANELDTIEIDLVEVQFYIQNEGGEFLDDAIIRLYDSDGGVGVTLYSHSGGEYSIDMTVDESGSRVYVARVFPGSYDFSVWVKGYERTSECISVSESLHSFTYVLGEETVADSGVCGDNLTWTLYDDYTLVISGTGDMYDYVKVALSDEEEEAPWLNVRFTIKQALYSHMVKYIVIEDGVTSIGDYAFYSSTDVSYIEMPDSITSIGEGAFSGCNSLRTVKFSENLVSIGRTAFANTRVSGITIPEGVTSIGDQAFNNCDFLSEIYIPASVAELGNAPFIYCGALEYIYYEGTEAQWDALTADIILGYQAEPEVCYESY